jgi:hypothetical protein
LYLLDATEEKEVALLSFAAHGGQRTALVPRLDLPGLFAAAVDTARHLPGDLRQVLRDLRRDGNQESYLLLTGLPVDESELLPTPSSTPAPVERPLQAMEAWPALVDREFGLPVVGPRQAYAADGIARAACRAIPMRSAADEASWSLGWVGLGWGWGVGWCGSHG